MLVNRLRRRPNSGWRLAQAKIIQKSVILFWLFNMTIWCKLELQKFIIFVLRIHQLG